MCATPDLPHSDGASNQVFLPHQLLLPLCLFRSQPTEWRACLMIKQNHPRCTCPSMFFLVLKLPLVGTSAESCRKPHLTGWRNEQILLCTTYPAVILAAFSISHQHLGLGERHSHPTQTAPRVYLRTPFAALDRSYVLQACRSFALDTALFTIALFLATPTFYRHDFGTK